VPYDDLWLRALYFPMIWKSDLDTWLNDWSRLKKISWHGKKSSERSFKRDAGHVIERIANVTLE
jgi:hypothetical protein